MPPPRPYRYRGRCRDRLAQREAKQFALAGAVFDQENGGVRTIYREDIGGECAGPKLKRGTVKWPLLTVSYDDKRNVINDIRGGGS